MQQGLVSVIVPVYGVEKYLDRCVESIVHQTYTNLEIILVDDGSQDRCPEMCDAWAKKDPRIRVIHKQNAGLGMARNTGIENATGEYICFFDSDDYVALDTIEKSYTAIRANGADLVLFGFCSVSSQGDIRAVHIPNTEKSLYRGTEIIEYILPNLICNVPGNRENTNLNMSVCMTLFSMRLIQKRHWRFVSERTIISEDVYSFLELFDSVSSVAVLPAALYHYRENQTSLSRLYRKDRYDKTRFFYKECCEVCQKKGYPFIVVEQLGRLFLSFTISALKQTVNAQLPLSRKIQLVRDVVEDATLQRVLHSLTISRETIQRKVLFTAMRNKMHGIVFCLICLKARQ